MSELELKSCIVNLRRLLHCMTNDPYCRHSNNQHDSTSTETTASPSLLVMRAEMARSLLHDIAQRHEQLLVIMADECNNHDYTRIIQDLQQQVEYACQKADEVVATQQIQQQQQSQHSDKNVIDNMMNHDNTDWVHVIFEQPEQTMTSASTTTLPRRKQQQQTQAEEGEAYFDDDDDCDEFNGDNGDDESTNDNIHQESSSLHHNTTKNYSVEELQKQQRQQLEEEISLMAHQLKKSTQSMHTTLQHQTQDLQDMEDLAVDNVDRVTGITKDTKEHLRKSWKSSIGKYTMVFVILGTFFVTFMTIRIVPKRSNACVPFVTCRSSTQQKQEQCIILDDGTNLCGTTTTTSSSSSSPRRSNKEGGKNTNPLSSVVNTKEEEEPKKKEEKEEDCYKECSADNDEICCSYPTTGSTGTKFQEESDDDHDDNAGQKKKETAASRKQAEAERQKRKQLQEEAQKAARLAATRRQQQQQLEEEAKRLGEKEIENARLVAMNKAAAQQEREDAEKEAARRQQAEAEKKKKQEATAQEAARRQQAKAEKRKQQKVAVGRLEAEAEAKLKQQQQQQQQQQEIEKAQLVAAKKTAEQQRSSANRNQNKGDDDSEKGEKRAYQYDKESFFQNKCPRNSDGECITNFDAGAVARAASHNDVEALRYYLSVMPQYASSVDGNGWQPIHEGARFGHTEILRVLITIGGVDANAPISGDGVTPLELAYAEGFDDNHDAVKLLKAQGGIVSNYRAGEDDDDGKKYSDVDFRRAANHGDISLLENIIAANPSIDINGVDENGWGALHEAVRNNDRGLETVQFLVDIAGCDVNLKKGNGPKAVEIATEMYGDNNKIVQYLRQIVERSSQQGSHRNEL